MLCNGSFTDHIYNVFIATNTGWSIIYFWLPIKEPILMCYIFCATPRKTTSNLQFSLFLCTYTSHRVLKRHLIAAFQDTQRQFYNYRRHIKFSLYCGVIILFFNIIWSVLFKRNGNLSFSICSRKIINAYLHY